MYLQDIDSVTSRAFKAPCAKWLGGTLPKKTMSIDAPNKEAIFKWKRLVMDTGQGT